MLRSKKDVGKPLEVNYFRRLREKKSPLVGKVL